MPFDAEAQAETTATAQTRPPIEDRHPEAAQWDVHAEAAPLLGKSRSQQAEWLKANHPDVGGSEDEFKRVRAALDIATDPERLQQWELQRASYMNDKNNEALRAQREQAAQARDAKAAAGQEKAGAAPWTPSAGGSTSGSTSASGRGAAGGGRSKGGSSYQYTGAGSGFDDIYTGGGARFDDIFAQQRARTDRQQEERAEFGDLFSGLDSLLERGSAQRTLPLEFSAAIDAVALYAFAGDPETVAAYGRAVLNGNQSARREAMRDFITGNEAFAAMFKEFKSAGLIGRPDALAEATLGRAAQFMAMAEGLDRTYTEPLVARTEAMTESVIAQSPLIGFSQSFSAGQSGPSL